MNITALRDTLRVPEKLQQQAFSVLQDISRLVASPEHESVANEMVLRALECRDYFHPYQDILDSLVRAVGLFPYLEQDGLSFRDAVAYEFHRPENMGEEFVFHREQAEIYRRLLDGDSVILSAPTSFGKSKIIDALIASGRFRNVVVVVPTLALIDETRRRLSQFSERFKIVTHVSQEPADSNIFVLTAERAIAYERFPLIEFFVIDEFYKLDSISNDSTRAVALNQAFYKLRKAGGQFYLLGPSIQHIPSGLEAAFKCYFYPTKFATVVSEQIKVPGDGDDIDRLIELCETLTDPTLVFCRSPARVNEVAHALLARGVGIDAPELSPAAEWSGRNYHQEWVLSKSLPRGIGIHHGKLPRALAQYVVRMFNDLKLRFLICTSTLIEGVNTKAKNVVIFDNRIAREKIDFFTFNNIKGRSGRMFEHFVGNVYLFNDPPTENLPFVDFPLFTQNQDAPDSLLVQMDDGDLVPSSRERMRKYQDQNVLPVSTLRENSSIDPDAQMRLASHLMQAPREWSESLSWSSFPTSQQLEAVCELIWSFLVQASRSRGGVFSARQLAFKVWQMKRVPDTSERVRQELRPGKYAARSPDEAVERVLEFERTWASFELPRYLMAVSRIQRTVFERMGLPFGDYSGFASQVECLFHTPVVAALDEYGVPLPMGVKISNALGETDDLDAALAKLKRLRGSRLNLDVFETELLRDAKAYLP
ncbi:MAG TPA: DEAD/DEAH box helicase [Rhodocyclaceae bacterium]|nr:DEAD/DEAH box helicase [Rhodocyclaceae bacterium]